MISLLFGVLAFTGVADASGLRSYQCNSEPNSHVTVELMYFDEANGPFPTLRPLAIYAKVDGKVVNVSTEGVGAEGQHIAFRSLEQNGMVFVLSPQRSFQLERHLFGRSQFLGFGHCKTQGEK